MHTTETRGKIKFLKRNAIMEMRAARYLRTLNISETNEWASNLEKSSSEKMRLIQDLKAQARLEDLTVYEVKMKKFVRKKETKVYSYWFASWREETKIRNVYIGSTKEMSYEEAVNRARNIKGEYLGITVESS